MHVMCSTDAVMCSTDAGDCVQLMHVMCSTDEVMYASIFIRYKKLIILQ